MKINRPADCQGKTFGRPLNQIFPGSHLPIDYNDRMRDMDELFEALGRSAFRSRFALWDKEARYLAQKGLPAVLDHARDFVKNRLAPANLPNDGKQTPTKNHPVFIAQHATATCCRGCLQKWHHIPKGAELTPEQIDYIIAVIARWLRENSRTK